MKMSMVLCNDNLWNVPYETKAKPGYGFSLYIDNNHLQNIMKKRFHSQKEQNFAKSM